MTEPHGHTSTLLINQLTTDQYYAVSGGDALADAIVDLQMHIPVPNKEGKI